jgi:N-methylhydantoinase B
MRKPDPITLNIVGNALTSITEEMGLALFTSAYSTIVREGKDLSVALLDLNGDPIATGSYVPQLINAITPAFHGCTQYFPVKDLKPKEGLITNDPYHGGQHLNDTFLYTPIFVEGALLAIAASAVHHIDIGGATAGGNAEAGDIYQEGIIIPPVKIEDVDNWEEGTFGRFFRANIRVPEKTFGDLRSQFAANRTGGERFKNLVERYGKNTIFSCINHLMDYSEKFVREAIQEIPDGEYFGESFMEDDGLGGGPYYIRVRLEVKGSDILIDFTGTDRQTKGIINNPYGATISAAFSTILSLLRCGDIPKNGGCFRPVRIVVPEETILHAKRPAAFRGRTSTCYKIFDAIQYALAPAIPDKVVAPGFHAQTCISLSRESDKEWSVFTEVLGGGNGASKTFDGADGMIMILTNGLNTPIEAAESEYDFFQITEYGYVQDSCGAGTLRGGVGLERYYKILKDDVILTTHSDRHRHSAHGLFAGESGLPGSFTVERGGKTIKLGSKVNFVLKKGDVLRVASGGGAGYGSPSKRESEKIQTDLNNGFISQDYIARHFRHIKKAPLENREPKNQVEHTQ